MSATRTEPRESAMEPPEPTGKTRAARHVTVVRELGVVAVLVLLVAVTFATNSRFLSEQSVRDLLLGAAILVVLAAGQTLVIITRNVDLSVGSLVGLIAFGTGKLLVEYPGAPLVVAISVGMLAGAAFGALNGALVALAKVPALVITLGTLYIYRSIDHLWASGQQINAADMPPGFLDFGRSAGVLGIPWLAWIALVVVIIASFALHSFRSGRELYAIGSDPDAARLSGIPIGRRVFAVFAINGALAGLAGVLYAARYGTLDATVGTGLELEVVAAVVIGGVAIFGGSGTVYGAAVGAILLTTIDSALPVLHVDPFWQLAFVGLLILAAIGLDRLLSVRLTKRMKGRSAHAV
ncbi:MAG TPA: ABC transporter permease [Nocardioidaceae bacterium]|nr:ABC transporter permease [Nocardioidaceae bacterium]